MNIYHIILMICVTSFRSNVCPNVNILLFLLLIEKHWMDVRRYQFNVHIHMYLICHNQCVYNDYTSVMQER